MIKKLHLKSLLLIAALLVGSSSAWAATGDEITDHADIVSGKSYYIKAVKSNGNIYYLNFTDQASNSASGTGVTSSSNAQVITIEKNGTNSFYLRTANGYYLTPAASNGKLKITSTQTAVAASSSNDKIAFSITSDNDTWAIQLNSGTSTNFGGYKLTQISVTLIEAASVDVRSDPELSFTTANYDVSMDDVSNFVSQTVNNPHDLQVTYSVTPASVATINSSTGVVSLTGAKGKATVTASFAGNTQYRDGTAKYTINVYNPNTAVFDFVQLTETYNSGVTPTTDGSSYVNADKNWTNGVITITTTGKYRWWQDNNNNGTLRFYDDTPKPTIVVTAAAGYILTDIAITGGQAFVSNDEAYSSSNGKWSGQAKSITLTQNSSSSVNVKTITVEYSDKVKATVQSYGWASFIAPAPVQFAANTAYVVTDASIDDGLTLAAVTTVPAGTPLLLKGAGEKTATVIASATAPATNHLSVCNGTIASGYYPYVLAKNGEGACFKQWTGDASALTGRVVLLLNEQVSTRSTYDLDDEMTGITGVNLNENQNDNRYYDLQGRHVAQPTKGLYIVNGKKIVVK